MRIREVMCETSLSKKTIHYYIQERLLQPATEANGYYDFSDTDIDTLKAIHQLRVLDLPLNEIYAILQNPGTAVFFLINHKRKLHHSKASLNRQYEIVSELNDNLVRNISKSQLIDLLKDNNIKFLSEQEGVTPIDAIDAEVITYHFLGNFMRELEMTEYRRFLSERLQKYLIANQTEEMVLFRDYLYSLGPSNIGQEYLRQQNNLVDEIAALEPAGYSTYVEKMISTVEKKLQRKTWVLNWREHYYMYIHPATSYYASGVSEIMCEFSSFYEKYRKNILGCCELFFEYIESSDGSAFKANLFKKLHGYLDISASHKGELAGLYFF